MPLPADSLTHSLSFNGNPMLELATYATVRRIVLPSPNMKQSGMYVLYVRNTNNLDYLAYIVQHHVNTGVQ